MELKFPGSTSKKITMLLLIEPYGIEIHIGGN